MRIPLVQVAIAILLVCLGAVLAQESKTAEKTRPPTLREAVDLDRMWSFHFQGKKSSGSFLELAQPDAQNEGKGRTLVITHLEVRMRQTMRYAFVQHKKTGRAWRKTLRRSEYFSQGWLDGATKFMVSGYSSFVGMRFKPNTRPSLEITQGSGDMAVYAEGYWAD